jgi:hypothetical protein
VSDDRSEPSTPAEQRLEEILGVLAADQPQLDPTFAGAVVRRARLQRAVVAPLRTVGSLVAAVGDSIRSILGVRPADGDR